MGIIFYIGFSGLKNILTKRNIQILGNLYGSNLKIERVSPILYTFWNVYNLNLNNIKGFQKGYKNSFKVVLRVYLIMLSPHIYT